MNTTGLLIVENNIVTISPEALLHQEYADIWNRDKSKNKLIATKELGYIYFFNCFNKSNPYRHYPESERGRRIVERIKLPVSWKPDDKIKEAEKLFNSLQMTRSMMFVIDAQYAVDQLRKYFRRIDFSAIDERGQPIYKATDLSRVLKDAEGLLTQLRKLEDKVRNESIGSGDIYGGGEIGIYEE